MSNSFFQVPVPYNEPVLSYSSGSSERKQLKDALDQAKARNITVPMYIDGKKVFTQNLLPITSPHDHRNVLGAFCEGDESHVKQAIDAALAAKKAWSDLSWEYRAAIFLKAADLLAGPYRQKMNAATMLSQSKNAYQAEIDCVCELIDFWRFNAYFMTSIYQDQPQSAPGSWNRMEYRPLEGFTFAITPFNFTSIAGNLPTCMALMGNTVIWKPAYSQIYSARVVMEILMEAGLPEGVINLIYVDGPIAGKIIFSHHDFSGIHFTGSTQVFKSIWKEIGNNIDRYKAYPRIVGETGGKDFVMVHSSARPEEVATALARGAFEYQGQKCSAASRAYIPDNLWSEVKKHLLEQVKTFRMGDVCDFQNFINAVIDQAAFDKIVQYLEDAARNPKNEILTGGGYDKSEGYFIEPTIILTKDPSSPTMREEIFGPVLTIYIYPEHDFESTLDLVDRTSPYALTGSIFSTDRYAIRLATQKLSHAAGNFYINDKPTGAVVGQQPFGGARASGTNDKAGAKMNLLRWVSAQSIKETFVPPVDYRYPFLK